MPYLNHFIDAENLQLDEDFLIKNTKHNSIETNIIMWYSHGHGFLSAYNLW